MGRMKKLLAVLLIATMAFVMTGCSTEEGGGDDKGGDKKYWRFPYDFAV